MTAKALVLYALSTLTSVFTLACGSEDSSEPNAGDDTVISGGDAGGDAGGPDVLVGAFAVELVAAVPEMGNGSATPAFTSLIGRVDSGPTPQSVIWESSLEQGDCVLLEPRLPFCDPACGSGRACVEDDVCEDYPDNLDVGTVTVRGLATEDGDTEFSMDPLPPSNTYQPTGGIRLAYPPFDVGDSVELEASGGDVAGFSVQAPAIEPLDVATEDDVLFESGKPVVLEWQPSDEADARIVVAVDISHHGGQKGEIDCEAPDTGSLEIPADLVTGLLDLGWAGFPSLQITRRTVGSTVIAPGRVDLTVSSSVMRHIEIPGLVSCTSDTEATDCPDGQTCGSDSQCQ